MLRSARRFSVAINNDPNTVVTVGDTFDIASRFNLTSKSVQYYKIWNSSFDEECDGGQAFESSLTTAVLGPTVDTIPNVPVILGANFSITATLKIHEYGLVLQAKEVSERTLRKTSVRTSHY